MERKGGQTWRKMGVKYSAMTLVLATSALYPLSGTFKMISIPLSNMSLASPLVPGLPMVLALVLPRILALHIALTSVLLVLPQLLVSPQLQVLPQLLVLPQALVLLLLLISPSLLVLPLFLPQCISLIKHRPQCLSTTTPPSHWGQTPIYPAGTLRVF